MQRFAGAEGVELRWVGTMPERTISASWRDGYYWDAALMDYLVMGREVSATGYLHIHLYVQLKKL